MNMSPCSAFLAAIGIIAPAVSGAAAVDSLNLAYKWKVDQPAIYQVTQDSGQKMSGTPMGDMEGSTHQVSTLRLKPIGVAEDGTATIEASFQAIRLEMRPLMQQASYAYDSANPGENESQNPLAPAVKAMIDKPFTVVLGPDGSVKKVDGVQAIADQIGKDGSTPAAANMAKMLKTTFNDQTVSKLFEVGFHHLPDKAVEPGSTWDSSYDMPIPQMGTMKAAGQATLSNGEGGNAQIESNYTITLEPPAAGQPVNPMMQNIKVEKATGRSTTLFDPARGMLIRHSGKVEMPTTISMAGPNGQETKINILINSSTALELVEDKR